MKGLDVEYVHQFVDMLSSMPKTGSTRTGWRTSGGSGSGVSMARMFRCCRFILFRHVDEQAFRFNAKTMTATVSGVSWLV